MTGATGPQGPQGPQGTAGTNGTGFNFRGSFDPSATYAANDVVTFAPSAITYNVSLTFDHSQCSQPYGCSPGSGTGSAVGTITTDGTIGVLSPANIVSFNLTLNDGSHTGILTPSSGATVVGTGFSATSTNLLVDYGNQSGFEGAAGQLCFTDDYNCFPGAGAGMWGVGGNNLWIWSNVSGVQAIATGGTVSTGSTSTYIATGPVAAGTVIPGTSPWIMMAQQGAAGASGSQGPAGAAGPQGPTGLTGATGPQGPAGAVGATGPQGSIGLTGATGAQGPAGAVGATGPQGSIGLTGATGAQGPIGFTGAQGPQGTPGTAGTNGTGFNFTGPFNNSTSYNINDVATYNGSTYVATVVNQGAGTPDSNPTDWTVMAQQGAAGATGAQGPAGAQGPQGPIGLTGANGAQGPAGVAGPQGAAGTNGTNGINGTAFNFTGAWSSTQSYNVNDVATFNGASYIAMQSNSAKEPDLSSNVDVFTLTQT
ncbi:MAG: hypothetical protein WB566_11700, partial [Terriglobales bacterium]